MPRAQKKRLEKLGLSIAEIETALDYDFTDDNAESILTKVRSKYEKHFADDNSNLMNKKRNLIQQSLPVLKIQNECPFRTAREELNAYQQNYDLKLERDDLTAFNAFTLQNQWTGQMMQENFAPEEFISTLQTMGMSEEMAKQAFQKAFHTGITMTRKVFKDTYQSKNDLSPKDENLHLTPNEIKEYLSRVKKEYIDAAYASVFFDLRQNGMNKDIARSALRFALDKKMSPPMMRDYFKFKSLLAKEQLDETAALQAWQFARDKPIILNNMKEVNDLMKMDHTYLKAIDHSQFSEHCIKLSYLEAMQLYLFASKSNLDEHEKKILFTCANDFKRDTLVSSGSFAIVTFSKLFSKMMKLRAQPDQSVDLSKFPNIEKMLSIANAHDYLRDFNNLLNKLQNVYKLPENDIEAIVESLDDSSTLNSQEVIIDFLTNVHELTLYQSHCFIMIQTLCADRKAVVEESNRSKFEMLKRLSFEQILKVVKKLPKYDSKKEPVKTGSNSEKINFNIHKESEMLNSQNPIEINTHEKTILRLTIFISSYEQ